MTSITEYLEQWAAAQPDKQLFGFVNAQGIETRGFTYREFLHCSRALAAYLHHSEGLRHGERVLLCYPPGLEIIVAFFACARLGLIPVPVAPPGFRAPMNRVNRIADECKARAVLTTQGFLRGLNSSELRWIPTDTPIPQAKDSPLHPNRVLFLQYTSGSTGDPRGVIVSHGNVIQNALATIDHVPVGVSWLPEYHDMGLIGYYLFPVICGGSTFGFSPQDFLKTPALWLRMISRVRATYASSPNFGFEYCLRPGKIQPNELQDVDLSCLRVLMNAAEPVSGRIRERFLERFASLGLSPEACVVAYGLAEHTLAATNHGRRTLLLDRSSLHRGQVHVVHGSGAPGNKTEVASCGKPLAGVDLRIVNQGTRRPLQNGKIGEIWLAGPSTSKGYWQRKTSTQEIFGNRLAEGTGSQSRFLRTGDLGFIHQGELFVCGRAKDLVIVRGVNHYPQDIESAVEAACPAIRKGGVAAFQGPDETLVVVIEIRNPPSVPNAAALALAIRTNCLVTPDALAFSPPHTISRTTSGKLARQVTRERYCKGELPSLLTYHPPEVCAVSTSQESLRDRFHNIFALCGSADPQVLTLADLGLDSLLLTELLLNLETVFQRLDDRGPVADCLDTTLLQRLTVAQFSRMLSLAEDGSAEAISLLRSELQATRAAFDRDISQRMRSDAQLPAFAFEHPFGSPPRISHVLLTGATGFFGPFLLSSLLTHTQYRFHVLVRARDTAHARERIREAMFRSSLYSPALAEQIEQRVHPVCGDIAQPDLGLPVAEWQRLANQVHAVIHNAAAVNYVANYEALKPHNVDGTRTILRFTHTGRPKQLHYISSTFIFGWTARGLLLESDHNAEMANLDFGYAQTKWVAEQLVLAAQARGLDARIYRPSLVSTSTTGAGDRNDVAVRLLAFMINHGIAVDTKNQLSILPADIVAHNIVSIVQQRGIAPGTFHVTADDYYNMVDLTRTLTREHGCPFTYYDIPEFIRQMNQLCTKTDPLYPLLDFFNKSASKIAEMQLKRYRNDDYSRAREKSGNYCKDPTLNDTASYLMAYLQGQQLIRDPLRHS